MRKKNISTLILLSLMIPFLLVGTVNPVPVQAAVPSGTILTVDGYDDIEYTYSDLLSLDNVTKVGWMGTPGNLNGSWKGVPLNILGNFSQGPYWLSYTMTIYAPDGYHRTYDWNAIQNGSCMIAYSVNGTPLVPEDHGYIRAIWVNGSSSYWITNASKIVLTPITGDSRLDYNVTISNLGKEYVFMGLNLTSQPNITSRGGYVSSYGTQSGPFDRRGVNLTMLLEMTGPWNSTSALKMTARDGYVTLLDYNQVMNNGTHTMILAYETEGDLYPSSGSPQGPRILVVGDTSPITDGHACPWGVWKIEVIHNVWQPFTFDLFGVSNYTIDHSFFYAAISCDHSGNVTQAGISWEGVPFWLFVGFVDLINSHDDYQDSQSTSATIRTNDGTVLTIPRSIFDRDDSFILASMKNGEVIFEEYPIVLTGHGYEVWGVTNVTLDFSNPPASNSYNIANSTRISTTNPEVVPFLAFGAFINFTSLSAPTMINIQNSTLTPTLESVSFVTQALNISSTETVTSTEIVRLYYTDAQLLAAGVLNELTLTGYQYQDGTWVLVTSTVNPTQNYVEFTLTSLGPVVLGNGGGGGILDFLPIIAMAAAGIVAVSIILVYFVKIKPKKV
ncbi:MAG: hypothetical protein ACTSUV_02390 [Candidatus Ranarchaeia archaeon]